MSKLNTVNDMNDVQHCKLALPPVLQHKCCTLILHYHCSHVPTEHEFSEHYNITILQIESASSALCLTSSQAGCGADIHALLCLHITCGTCGTLLQTASATYPYIFNMCLMQAEHDNRQTFQVHLSAATAQEIAEHPHTVCTVPWLLPGIPPQSTVRRGIFARPADHSLCQLLYCCKAHP